MSYITPLKHPFIYLFVCLPAYFIVIYSCNMIYAKYYHAYCVIICNACNIYTCTKNVQRMNKYYIILIYVTYIQCSDNRQTYMHTQREGVHSLSQSLFLNVHHSWDMEHPPDNTNDWKSYLILETSSLSSYSLGQNLDLNSGITIRQLVILF